MSFIEIKRLQNERIKNKLEKSDPAQYKFLFGKRVKPKRSHHFIRITGPMKTKPRSKSRSKPRSKLMSKTRSKPRSKPGSKTRSKPRSKPRSKSKSKLF